MDIRKIVRESVGKVFESHQNRGPFTGLDILNQYPFSKLPDVRANVDWSKRDVAGWGPVQIPSLTDGDALGTAFGQDDVIDFVNDFVKKYGEEPIFMLYPNEVWYGKIKVINPKFLEWRDNYGKMKQAWVDKHGSGD